jgi:hypothetical protein
VIGQRAGPPKLKQVAVEGLGGKTAGLEEGNKTGEGSKADWEGKAFWDNKANGEDDGAETDWLEAAWAGRA